MMRKSEMAGRLLALLEDQIAERTRVRKEAEVFAKMARTDLEDALRSANAKAKELSLYVDQYQSKIVELEGKLQFAREQKA